MDFFLVRYSDDLNNEPFNEHTVLDHLNTKLVRYSDPHCIWLSSIWMVTVHLLLGFPYNLCPIVDHHLKIEKVFVKQMVNWIAGNLPDNL